MFRARPRGPALAISGWNRAALLVYRTNRSQTQEDAWSAASGETARHELFHAAQFPKAQIKRGLS